MVDRSLFMRACRREPVERTPVWLMRQAGRYMQEYRKIREKVSFKDLCRNPDLAAEVTVTAAARLGVDAAIVFSDLLTVTDPLGFPVEYTEGEGPVIRNPVREAADVRRARRFDPAADLGYVMAAVRKCRETLPAGVPLIGFAGAPFTIAAYLIEGGASRSFTRTKRLMQGEPGAWRDLLDLIVEVTVGYINGQVAAGAQAVQFFDSWVGCLSPHDYRESVLPFSRKLIRGVTPGTPVIHFGTQTAGLLETMREAGGDVIGVDWRVSLAEAWDRLGGDVGIMGNLDPAALLGPRDRAVAAVRRVLDEAGGRPGHIFNLGHGVLPETPVENAIAVIETVREHSRR